MLYRIFGKYFFLFLFLWSVHFVKAQLGKEAWHWQFGNGCALDFSSGVPLASTSIINTLEGCTSVSDPNTGQLLFYTDGTIVWDRNNNQMPNGFGLIGGHGTSTQAALIVPLPGSSTIYYLFSADQGGYYNFPSFPNQGVHYSIVDMSLNGGLGDVATKNILLTPPPATEKLTAVRHCNGTDYWIITHPFNSNAFNVYPFTSAGINITPIVSNIGTVQNNISGRGYETIGYLKASPNGKKLGCAVDNMNFAELFDFDNFTGQVSNQIHLGTINAAYGIAFSPDNSKLYVASEYQQIFQFDISSGNAATIISSQTTISLGHGGANLGAIQLAPDGKIYVSYRDSTHLAVFNSPNNPAVSCNFQYNGPSLLSGDSCQLGLPNIIDAYNPYPSQIYNTSLCPFPIYTLSATSGNLNYNWSTGDTTQNIHINTFGNYWVSYFNAQGCKEVDTFHIMQTQPPTVNVLKDTAQCSNLINPLNLNATDTNAIAYLWNNGSTIPIQTITIPGSYWIDYTFSNFCMSKDSFSYTINKIPSVNLGNDTTFCLGDLPLNAYNQSSSYLWSTGQTTSTITATKAETYWVKVTNQYGCANYDSLVVYPETSLLNFTMPNIVTPNHDNTNDVIDFGKYQFSSMQLDIYNRWGIKIFENSNPDCIWKPTEDDGTYYYILQYIINCGTATENKTLKGFITLAR